MPPAAAHGAQRSVPPRPERGAWAAAVRNDQPDPFATNPIRRSTGLVAASAVAFFGPLVVGGPEGTTAMLAGGWVGMIGLAIGVPVLVLSLIEAAWECLRARLDPPIDRLNLSPRLTHLLHRHGYDSIALVEQTPDAVLLLLSNMDRRGLREVRRAAALWRYRRWQEAGFP